MEELRVGGEVDHLHSPREGCCGYVDRYGNRCREPLLEGSQFCFWHDPKVSKNDPCIKDLLEQRARSGKPMRGFKLRGARLQGIDLVNHGNVNDGLDLSDADLYRADLTDAHLYHINLENSNLMKAILFRANLNNANLQGCNLLGVDFNRSKLQHVEWGDCVLQGQQARQIADDPGKASSLYQEAEEICRNIRKYFENHGLFDQAGRFFQDEMVYRRMQMPLWSWPRTLSKLVDLFSGYGERPVRVVGFSIMLIFLCAFAYHFVGITDSDRLVKYSLDADSKTNILTFLECVYFSVVTFTTLGYGDLAPIGFARFIAAVEAFIGSFSIALFVVVFVKKMTR